MRRCSQWLGWVAISLLLMPTVVWAQAQAVQSSGGLTANGSVGLDVTGMGTASIAVSGTYSGTINFEASSDPGGTVVVLNCATPAAPTVVVTTTTSTGTWTCTVAGLKYLQARMSSYVSGTAQIFLSAARGGGGGGGGGGAASSVTINDPTITTQKAAVNGSGQLSITCANCSGSGASAVDRSTFVLGTTSLAPGGGIFDDTPPTALTTGMAGIFRMTANRGIHFNLRNQAGTEMGTAAAPLQVTGANGTFPVSGTFWQATQPVSGTVAVSTVPADPFGVNADAQSASGSISAKLRFIATTGIPITGTVTTALPTAAALSDATANPTVPGVGAFLMAWNGATWDRAKAATTTEATHNVALTLATTKGLVPMGRASAAAPTDVTADSNAVIPWYLRSGAQVSQLSAAGTLITATGANLNVQCANCSGSGASIGDRGTWTFGTTSLAPGGGVFDDTPPADLTTGMAGVFRMTAKRAVHLNLRNVAGAEIGIAAAPLRTDPTGSTIQPVNGTVTANVGTTNGLALDASVTGLQVALASTTSGQKGGLAVGAVTTAAPSYTTAQTNALSLTTAGGLRVDGSGVTQPVSGTVALGAGSALAGEMVPVATATTTDTTLTSYLTSAATTNATVVKASAGNVYLISAINTTATLYYLRMYNLTAATCSSATGFVETIPVPASATGAGLVRPIANGQAYGTGISYCLTGGGSSTDNTAAATGVYVTVLYK